MRLLLIRHGESASNYVDSLDIRTRGRRSGRVEAAHDRYLAELEKHVERPDGDSQLTARGHEQAAALGGFWGSLLETRAPGSCTPSSPRSCAACRPPTRS